MLQRLQTRGFSLLKRETGLPFVITGHLSTMMKPTIDERLHKTANEAYVSADALIAVSPVMDLTIEAFAQAFRDDKKVTLTIFGEGP